MEEPPSIGATEIDALLDFLPGFESPDFEAGQWLGGIGQAPYFAHSPHLKSFVAALAEHRFIYRFDYVAWLDSSPAVVVDPTAIAGADLLTLRRLVTAFTRQARFIEGHLARLIVDGPLLAVLHRLQELRDVMAREVVLAFERVAARDERDQRTRRFYLFADGCVQRTAGDDLPPLPGQPRREQGALREPSFDELMAQALALVGFADIDTGTHYEPTFRLWVRSQDQQWCRTIRYEVAQGWACGLCKEEMALISALVTILNRKPLLERDPAE